MSDNSKKYDSVFVGYADEPKFDANGKFISQRLRLKKEELRDMIDRFSTAVKADGTGGNVFITMGVSKNGKPFATVWDPNSDKAQERQQSKDSYSKPAPAASNGADEDLPF
jgi:hypothetical protein